MKISTSVVICTYTERRWDAFLAAVISVQSQKTPPDQIIIVVDHNPELLLRIQENIAGVEVLASNGPRGLSGARNTAIGFARGEVLIFLDDDAVADEQWLERLVAPFHDVHVLGAGGSALPVWESAKPAWWPEEFGWVIGCSYRGQPEERASVRNLMGCNMAMRRSIFDVVGEFKTELGRTANTASGCEETEWCIRASDHFPDGLFVHEPLAIVHHQVPEARATWSYFRKRCYAEGVSKSRVTRAAGVAAGLSAERTYVRQILPIGVLHNLGFVLRSDWAGPARAVAIAAGLGFTTAGYIRGKLSRATQPQMEHPPVPAVLPLIVDLKDPAAALRGLDLAGSHRSVLCLVTDDGKPVSKLRVELSADEKLTPELLRKHLATVRLSSSAPATGDAGRGPEKALAIPATVVIATRNRPEQLVECLASVRRGTVTPQRVIVVDNAPSDNRTAKVMKGLVEQDSRLLYVREDKPGLAHAHNAALPHIATDVVAFTDDDVLVDRRWLERLVRVFAHDGKAVCVTGMIAPRELETLPQQWVEGNVTYDKGLNSRVFDAAEGGARQPLMPYASGACGSGANMAFSTPYLREAGGFEAALGTGTVAMGGDDLAAFYDVLASGHRLVYEPAAIVLHPHHRDYAALRRQVYGYGAGLGAHLTRCFFLDPRMILALALDAASLRSRASRILHPPQVDGLPPYPKDLLQQHRRGLLSGPGRYVLSRYRLKRVTEQKGIR